MLCEVFSVLVIQCNRSVVLFNQSYSVSLMTHAGCVMMSLYVVTTFSHAEILLKLELNTNQSTHKCDKFVRNIIIYTVQTEILEQL